MSTSAEKVISERHHSELSAEIDKLRELIELNNAKTDQLADNIEGLVIAWNTAKGITSFVKWIGSISAGAGILWAAFHGGVPK